MNAKLLSSTIATLAITLSTFAQNIPNGNFENWTNKLLYEDAGLFMTSNSQAYMMGISLPVTKSTDKVSGNFAVRLETVANKTDTVQGFLILGSPGNQTINGGYPFTGHADSLTFFAKFNEKIGDTGVFIVFFKKNDTMIAMAQIPFYGSQLNYKRYSSPINWFMPGMNTPDTMAVIISCSNLDWARIPGSNLYIDSVKFIGTTSAFPNGNFENWNSKNSNEPDNWSTLNSGTTGTPMATKTTDKYNGTYALRIENVPMIWGGIAGYISNGFLGTGDKPTGGMTINQNPLKITGYYKYIPNGPDTAIAGIYLYRYNAVKDSTILIEDTIIKLRPVSTYTYFEIPIRYSALPSADTLNISFAASNYFDTTAFIGLGSVLFIDNLNIIYKNTSVDELKNELKVDLYPNPFSTSATLVIDDSKIKFQNCEMIIYDLFGREISKYEITKPFTEINRNNLSDGIYFYQIKTNSNEIIITKKIILN